MANIREVEANVIKASLLAGMRPVACTRSNGNPYMLLSNGKQSVFVAPYRQMTAPEVSVNIVNLANVLGVSSSEFLKGDDVSLDSLAGAVENIKNTMIDNLYLSSTPAGYESGKAMEEDNARMKKEAATFPVATKGTEAGVRYYIARKNLEEFARVARQVGIDQQLVASVGEMANPKGSKELVSIAEALDEKVAQANIKKSGGSDPAL